MDTLTTIKKLIDKNGLTQKALTDYLGISKNAFTNWSNGSNTSYIKHLPQIAEFFNVSVDYLLGREQTKKEPTVIANDGLNPKIHKITRLLETKDIPDEVIDFIYKALENYNK